MINNKNSIFLHVITLLVLLSSTYVSARDAGIVDLDSFFEQLEFKCSYYPKDAKNDLDSLTRNSSDLKLAGYEAHLEYIKSLFHYNDLQMDSALFHIERSISLFSVEDDKVWLAKCQLLLGEIAEVSGLFEQAKINYYEAINLLDGFEDYYLGFAYCGLARSKKALHEFNNDDLKYGVSLLTQAKREEIQLYGEFIDCWGMLDDSSVIERLNSLAERYLELKLYERAVNVYKTITTLYFDKGNIEGANKACDKAINLCKIYEVGKQIIPALYQTKGVLMYNQSKLNLSQVYFERSITLYKTHNQKNRIPYALDYLHKIEMEKGNYLMAYKYLEEYHKISKDITASDKIQLAKVLEVNNKVELMKSQLAQLQVEKRASEFMLYLVLLITIAILAAIAVYVYNYQKNKKAKIEELNKEFNNILIGIGEKRLLEHRLKDTKKVKDVPTFDIKLEDFDNSTDMAESFDSCYMETIGMFTEIFPQLTKTEVRYAVMMCLKLPMEVIAKVQNVQPSSIRKAKQRIRAKLEVDGNLENYLQEYREKQISNISI